MRYLKVEWHHSHSDEPTVMLSEVDSDRVELRKLEFFRDGRVGFASAAACSPGTKLSEAPIPPLAEIAADPQFVPGEIAAAEFEAAWQKAGVPA